MIALVSKGIRTLEPSLPPFLVSVQTRIIGERRQAMSAMEKNYRACIYTRLSRDDGDKAESDSIGNQKALIRDYLSKHQEIEAVSEHSDDGFTGVNFERPGFQMMMDEIRSGKVNCVVVKDLSRFGRNYIEAGNYIEKVFPFMGVRFIAINDNYDSKDKGQADSLVIPFKNLINDAYCKDISVKIRSQLEIKRKKGEFIGAFAPYGYQKDTEDHNRLVVDVYASEVVRSIFRWKRQGMSQNSIAARLNAQGVLCPMEYKVSQGMKVQTNFRVHKQAEWSPVTVLRILTNEIYTGTLLQGKTTTPNYKVKKRIDRPQTEWIRVDDAHEAVIDREMFDSVQLLLKKDTRISPEKDTLYVLSGYVVCSGCGQPMVKKTVTRRGRQYSYYVCATHKAKRGCSPNSIPEEKLNAAVLAAVRERVQIAADMEKHIRLAESMPKEQRSVKSFDVRIVKLKEDLEQSREFKLRLYESLQDGMIDQDEYFIFKKNYEEKIQKMQSAIGILEKERQDTLDGCRMECGWIEKFREYGTIESLDREAVVDLLEAVYVHDKQTVEIAFRFADEWKSAEEYIRHVEEGGE